MNANSFNLKIRLTIICIVVKRLTERKSTVIVDKEVSFAEFKSEAYSPKRDVLISELPRDATRDYVELFFENGPRSGGGPLEEVDINRHSRTARIVFKNSEGNNYEYRMA